MEEIFIDFTVCGTFIELNGEMFSLDRKDEMRDFFGRLGCHLTYKDYRRAPPMIDVGDGWKEIE
jgi:hypothetical protein